MQLVVLDQHAIHAHADAQLHDLRGCFADPCFLLVASAASARPAGNWDAVVTRPLSVADLVAAVQSLLPLPGELRRPLDSTA